MLRRDTVNNSVPSSPRKGSSRGNDEDDVTLRRELDIDGSGGGPSGGLSLQVPSTASGGEGEEEYTGSKYKPLSLSFSSFTVSHFYLCCRRNLVLLQSPTPMQSSSSPRFPPTLPLRSPVGDSSPAAASQPAAWCPCLCLDAPMPSLPLLHLLPRPLLQRIPGVLALLVLLVTCGAWGWDHLRRPTHSDFFPTTIPILAIPTSPGRGPSLLATLHSLEVPVDLLLLCNSAPGVPELGCILEEVKALVDSGGLPAIHRAKVVQPVGIKGRGPVYGVAECWNALAEEAFVAQAAPWAMIANDDVGFVAGALAVSVEEVWRRHSGHSLLLANEGLPGVGYAFSAFVLTRGGYRALGKFDENFFPAYYEDCDYLRRARLLGMPWRRLPTLKILHPIHKYLPSLPQPSAKYQACVDKGNEEEWGASIGVAIAGAVASMLDRARSPIAWRAFPYSDRHYYERKWGGGLGKVCGGGEFPTPFNDPRNTLDAWKYDPEMREATVKGTALEGVVDAFWLGVGGGAHPAPVTNTAGASGGDGGSSGGTEPLVRGANGDTQAAAALALGRKPQSPNSRLVDTLKVGNPRDPSDPLGPLEGD